MLGAAGLAVALLSPDPGPSTETRVAVLCAGQALCGIGIAAVIPTTPTRPRPCSTDRVSPRAGA